jgi:MATE family multidrug resistance protein
MKGQPRQSTNGSMPNDKSTTTASRAETATSLGHEFRLQRRIAVPLIAGFMAEIGMWFTDAVIVGHLGSTELGAVSLAGLIFWEIVLTGAAMLSVVGVFVGNAYGRGETAAVQRTVQQGLWLACALSLPVMVLSWHLMTLLSFTGQDAVVLSLGTDYLHTLIWTVLPLFLFTVQHNFLTGLARPRVVTVIVVLALPVNAALNYVLVFGALGLPAMGVAGAGLGTSIVNWLMLLALVAYIVRNPAFSTYNIFRNLGVLDFSEWRQICRIGLPAAGIRAIGGSVFIVLTVLMGLFGAAALAANHIVITVIVFSTVITVGLGETAAVRVAQEMGAGRPQAASRAGKLTISVGFASAACCAVILWLATGTIAAVFLDTSNPANGPVVVLIELIARIAAVYIMFEAVKLITDRALRGRQDTFVPMCIGAIGAWGMAIPLGTLLAFAFDQGPVGLWWGLAFGYATSAVLLWVRWRRLGAMP